MNQDYGRDQRDYITFKESDTYKRGEINYKNDVKVDSEIKKEALLRLSLDERLDSKSIHVDCIQRSIILFGHVRSWEQKKRAENLVETISEVLDVENYLRFHKYES